MLGTGICFILAKSEKKLSDSFSKLDRIRLSVLWTGNLKIIGTHNGLYKISTGHYVVKYGSYALDRCMSPAALHLVKAATA